MNESYEPRNYFRGLYDYKTGTMTLSTVTQFAIVALGGAFGAMSRFGVQSLPLFGEDKYYYTVVINVSGCLIMGILWAIFSHFGTSRGWELLVLTGFLGGYTTYSAFTLDAMELINRGQFWLMGYYIAITILFGLGGCALGLFGTDRLLRYFGY